MTRRLNYLDLLRVICVGLVMYGHFVLVAGGAKAIPGIINASEKLPLLDESTWRAYVFEVFLINIFSTQSAILGVCLFFLITGYLMPLMCERYGRKEFLINRVFRIYPTLISSIFFIGIFLYLVQDIVFPLESYVSSFSLLFFYTNIPNIAGVLWTLAIEVVFYLISCLVGRYTLQRLLVVQSVLLMAVLLGALYPDTPLVWITGWQARYLLMICIGSAIYLAEKEGEIFRKVQIIFPSFVFSYLGFQLFKFGRVDASTYETIGTHLLAVGVFLFFSIVGSKLITRTPRFVSIFSEMVYPLYLIHAAVGLATIALLRKFVVEPYILLLAAVVTSLVISWFLHILVERPSINAGRFVARKFFNQAGVPKTQVATG